MKKKISLVFIIAILFISLSGINYAQENQDVEITIPTKEIKINGTLINNQNNKHPMIVYKDICYLPLTEGYSRALGLITSWNKENEYIIVQDYNYDAPIQNLSENNSLNGKYYAKVLDSKITIKEEEIINSQEEYPFLTFRDIVYIPITTRFANKFGWKVFWDEEDGLSMLAYPPDVYDTAIVDDWIYFREDYKMYKMRLDGSEKTMFADAGESYQMIVKEDWIYYINASEERSLYKIKVDGSKRTKLSEDRISDLVGIDEDIYYIKEDSYSYDDPNAVYRISLEGKRETKIKNLDLGFLSFPVLQDGWIYYRNEMDDYKLYKIKINGKDKTKLTNERTSFPKIIDEWIYYVDTSEYHLYKVKLDGSDNTKITDEKIYHYVIDGDWIYYSNQGDKDKLYKIRLDGSEKSKLNNDRSGIIDIIGDWVYYKNYYGESLHFLSLGRINVNSGSREVLLPNGPTKYFYIDGQKIEEEKSGEWLLDNLKVSYYEINDDLASSIEIIKAGSSKISFVKHNADYINSYSDISLHEIGIDKESDRFIYTSDKETGYIIGLEANEKYVKWEELYKDDSGFYVDIYAYNLVSNKRILIKEKINCSINNGFYKIHSTLEDDHIAWLENHQDEEKGYIKLYDLANSEEKTLVTVDIIEGDNFQNIPISFVDMDNDKIVFDVRKSDGYYYSIYDIKKESIIKNMEVNDGTVIHFSGDYDSEKGLLGVYFLGESKNGYYEELGYIDINDNDYNKVYRLKEHEMIYEDRIQLKNSYLAYNIQKNISGYIYDHYFGYIINLENNETEKLDGSFEVKIYGDHIGNISFDKEMNINKINFEIMNINKNLNLKK